MKNIKKIVYFSIILTSSNTFAVKGINKVFVSEVKRASCLIEIDNSKLNLKDSICSGTLISSHQLITAKHCLLKNPKKQLEQERNILSRELKESELVENKNVSISCGGEKAIIASLNTHKYIDLAVISLKEELNGHLDIISKKEHREVFINQKTPKQCGIFGFGLNEYNEMKEFNGVRADDVDVYSFKRAFVEIEMDKDFKNIARYFANSIENTFTMNYDFFPHLLNANREKIVSQEFLVEKLDSFKQLLQNHKLRESSLYSVSKGPKFHELFLQHFVDLYGEVYTEVVDRKIEELAKKKLPLRRIILNVENSTLEKAGMDYGDSGGAFACKFAGSWKLVGVNSMIHSDSNRSYIPKPWEPMHSQPKSRVTKNGEAIYLTSDVKTWINLLNVRM